MQAKLRFSEDMISSLTKDKQQLFSLSEKSKIDYVES